MAKITVTNDDGSVFEMQGEIVESYYDCPDEDYKVGDGYYRFISKDCHYNIKLRLLDDRVMPAQPAKLSIEPPFQESWAKAKKLFSKLSHVHDFGDGTMACAICGVTARELIVENTKEAAMWDKMTKASAHGFSCKRVSLEEIEAAIGGVEIEDINPPKQETWRDRPSQL